MKVQLRRSSGLTVIRSDGPLVRQSDCPTVYIRTGPTIYIRTELITIYYTFTPISDPVLRNKNSLR